MPIKYSAYQRLSIRAVKKKIPLQCVFEITYQCNLHCVHCYLAGRPPRKELKLKNIFQILDELAQAGCLWLVLTGGEILLHKDFFKIAAYARQKNFNLILLTNGTLITKAVADKLQTLKPCVDISLYGFKETHDKITGVPGSFEKTLKGIELLLERGVRVSTKAVVMHENIDEVWRLRDFLEVLGVNVSISPDALLISPRDNGGLEPLKYRVKDQRKLQEYFAESARRLKETGKKFKLITEKGKDKLCGTGLSACSISPYGELNPCVQIKLQKDNSLLERSFADIWRNHGEISLLRSLTVADKKDCFRCKFIGYCFRCPGIAKLERGSYTAKIPEACRLAKIQKKIFEKEKVFKQVPLE